MDLTLIQNLIGKIIEFVILTKDYAINSTKVFVTPGAGLPVLIIGISFLYAILKGGLLDNWKLIVAAIVVSLLLTVVF